MDGREACRVTEISLFAVEETLKQHAYFAPGRVTRLPELLLRTGLGPVGSSQLPPRGVLERSFVSLSRRRRV